MWTPHHTAAFPYKTGLEGVMHTGIHFRRAFFVPLHSGDNSLFETDFINTMILSTPRALNIVCVYSAPS
jgi:hypothetical protein